ncbi:MULTISPECIES: TRM11 family methyltransferase [unclassified Methanosarcina]|uniref:TRM11 family SAM-dependent methyltransferase n=1 Tax=unclassified Methanosarcina TaxID=2644672 RepID=UPI000615A5B2|nr:MULTISPECIES: TRM11 family methyltransferase [unclassified Methanosarcina]AKB17007.1 tRNA-(G10-N2) methyltransferase [Methanosarcina sp. WWM596]AKB20416.1 tRNA-(G10-N2) methyltransferase [Methanosarcina sp. WH1]
MLYAFELSGEHEELPAAEVLACLKIEGLDFRPYARIDQCLVVDIAGREEDIERTLTDPVTERLAMTHHILKVVGITKNNPDAVLKLAEAFEPAGYIRDGKSFVVRAKRIKHHVNFPCEYLEQKIGGFIYRKGFRANLKSPDVEFRLILSEKAVLGTLLSSVDRSAYEARNPQNKPFFHPGVLMPRVARAITNLSGIKPGELFLDPFCGTAGILVEAGLMGARVIGIDAQEKLVLGAHMNLEAYELDYILMEGDACRIPLKDSTIDAVVTDPPYGRSAAILAGSLEELYSSALEEIHRVLKPGGIAVVVSDKTAFEYGEKAGLKVLEIYVQRVHRSLTRIITIFQKDME